jgi:hypothetical protein
MPVFSDFAPLGTHVKNENMVVGVGGGGGVETVLR